MNMCDTDKARMIKLLTVMHVRTIEARDLIRAGYTELAAVEWESLKDDMRAAEKLFRSYGFGFTLVVDYSLLEPAVP
jgi:hypothetical protein